MGFKITTQKRDENMSQKLMAVLFGLSIFAFCVSGAAQGGLESGGVVDEGNASRSAAVLKSTAGEWSGLVTVLDGQIPNVAPQVKSLTAEPGSVWAGGAFGKAAATTLVLNNISKTDGNVWMRCGISGGEGVGKDEGINAQVNALLPIGGGKIYVGGIFVSAGSGIVCNNVAYFDGTRWSAISTGTNGEVNALAADLKGNIYIGGKFSSAGGKTCSRVAKWDGKEWSALGSGLDGAVLSLACDGDGNLYAGGAFTKAGGGSCKKVAKWDGVTWSSLGSGVDSTSGYVWSLLYDQLEGCLYAGGGFTKMGGKNCSKVAKWNGKSWSELGSGVSGTVYSLAFDTNRKTLYVGGKFAKAGEIICNNVAGWDGISWAALGSNGAVGTSGVENVVYALTLDQSCNLYVGGCFDSAGAAKNTSTVAKYLVSKTAFAPKQQSMSSKQTAESSSGIGMDYYKAKLIFIPPPSFNPCSINQDSEFTLNIGGVSFSDEVGTSFIFTHKGVTYKIFRVIGDKTRLTILAQWSRKNITVSLLDGVSEGMSSNIVDLSGMPDGRVSGEVQVYFSLGSYAWDSATMGRNIKFKGIKKTGTLKSQGGESSAAAGVAEWNVAGKESTKLKASSQTSAPPARLLVGYWENWGAVIPLENVSPDFDFINIAFALPKDGTEGGTMEFSPQGMSDTTFKAGIKTLQTNGKKVLISLGGETGRVRLKTTEARDKFVKSMVEIIKRYGFNGLDIDFEGSSVDTTLVLDEGDIDFRNPTTPVIVNLISALDSICDQCGPGFILTMAPETFYVQSGYDYYGGNSNVGDRRVGSYLPVLNALRNRLTLLHVQLYNSGSCSALDGKMYEQGTADFVVAMTEMLLTGFPVAKNDDLFFQGLRPDQVAVGLPASVNAAGGGYIDPAEVQKALDYLILGKSFGGSYILRNEAGYPNLRGVMAWSINKDQQAGNAFSTQIRSYLSALP